MVVIRHEKEMEDSTPPQHLELGAAHFARWTIISCAKEEKIFNNSH